MSVSGLCGIRPFHVVSEIDGEVEVSGLCLVLVPCPEYVSESVACEVERAAKMMRRCPELVLVSIMGCEK